MPRLKTERDALIKYVNKLNEHPPENREDQNKIKELKLKKDYTILQILNIEDTIDNLTSLHNNNPDLDPFRSRI